jgi:hypothetical protein
LGPRSQPLVRAALIGLAVAAVSWSVPNFLTARENAPLGALVPAARHGDSYQPELAAKINRYVDRLDAAGGCRTSSDIAVLRLRTAASSIKSENKQVIEHALTQAKQAIRSALVCSPSQPYLWYALFWVESTLTQSKEDHLKYLEMSYELGPHEGWFSEQRCQTALPLLSLFSARMQEIILSGYLDMVKYDPDAAANVLASVDGDLRAKLVASLVGVPLEARNEFARVLGTTDLDVQVPGVVDRQPPWRKDRLDLIPLH